jgi:2-polyprenyl-3-methyl-5-hydroxy-6-metoxy-1,4-benzoquinol methylase
MKQEAAMIPTSECPACGSHGVRYRFAAADEFGLAKCGECGLVRTEPMPDEEFLAEFYQGFRFLEPSMENLESQVDRVAESLSHFIGPATQGGTFLDFGGGAGIYCLAGAKLGYESSLFEVDRQMVEFAREKMGLARVFMDLGELAGRKFSVILACHVIEHARDPGGFLSLLRGLLREDGVLVVATPNAEEAEKLVRPAHVLRYLRRVMRTRANAAQALATVISLDSLFCWDPPRHLFAYTAASLQHLARRQGMAAETMAGFNTDPLYEPRGYLLPPVSLRSLCSKRGLLNAVARWTMPVVRFLFPSRGQQLYAVIRPVLPAPSCE